MLYINYISIINKIKFKKYAIFKYNFIFMPYHQLLPDQRLYSLILLLSASSPSKFFYLLHLNMTSIFFFFNHAISCIRRFTHLFPIRIQKVCKVKFKKSYMTSLQGVHNIVCVWAKAKAQIIPPVP